MNVIVRIKGGMGNQMFEYACARAIQIRHQGDAVILDLAEMENERNGRKYALDAFRIPKSVHILKTHRYDKYSRKENPFLRIGQKLYPEMIYRAYAKNNIFIWDNDEYKKLKADNAGDIYLNGYWQSSRYFSDVSRQILSDFTFITKLNKEQEVKKRKISGSQSVCVHIRLGDYLNTANYLVRGGVCTREYYIKGMKIIKNKIPDAEFHIFSDDMAAAFEMLSGQNDMDMVFEGSNSEKADLELMSCCRHFVISNSTFSWWAQYLSKNKAKIVCAPSRWKNGQKVESIYEKNWILI